MPCFLIALLLALCAPHVLCADAPQWIWSGESPRAGDAPVFRRTFHLAVRPAAAPLRVLSEYAALELEINGRPAIQREPYEAMAELDAAPFLKAGTNTLTLRARAVTGPAAVALQLDLSPTNAIVTGADWQVEPGKRAPALRGTLAQEHWWSLPPLQLSESDDYTQWKRALPGGNATGLGALRVLPGFEAKLIRQARADEGSWISMAFDPGGRLILSREDQGLLRLTLNGARDAIASVETLDRELRECRGLLHAHGFLFASANNSKSVFRLRDTDGDGTYETRDKLLDFVGGTGHGRNDLAMGPSGRIHLIHGDDIQHHTNAVDLTSPLRRARVPFRPNEGHLTRFDAQGGRLEILAGGLRNPYGVAFNTDGEPFCYDADAEHDMGAPWYRPTRVVHLTPGADFGWRAVTGSWPPYTPDQPQFAEPAADIGRGSPTAVAFGTQSQFPPPFRDALFILDWAYGRILAVHMVPRGASYWGRAEEFLRGSPLNVTDLTFGPDGAMYFITGGRRTQSSLYRVEYRGPVPERAAPTAQQAARAAFAAKARAERGRMEALLGARTAQALPVIWEGLFHADPRIAYTARIALEHQPVARWRQDALAEKRIPVALAAWQALLAADDSTAPKIVEGLVKLDFARLPLRQQQAALQLHRDCHTALKTAHAGALRQLDAMYPATRWELNRPLSDLLATMNAPRLVPRTLHLLATATRQEERLHYLFVLRHAREGWTPGLRRDYFEALRDASRFSGGDGMPKFLDRIRQEALATLAQDERAALSALLTESNALPPMPDLSSRKFVREWKVADLEQVQGGDSKGRAPEQGRKLFHTALCSRCHRHGTQGYPVGPDLTHVSSRLGRRDLLEALLEPSKTIAQNYHTDKLTLTDGRSLTGRVVPHLDYRSPDLLFAEDAMFPTRTVAIPKATVRGHSKSEVSLMPAGLLNHLSRGEILDLLVFLENSAAK